MVVEVRKGPASGSLTVNKNNVEALFEEITISGNKKILKIWTGRYIRWKKKQRETRSAGPLLGSAKCLDYLCLCIKGHFTKLKNIQDLNSEDKRGMN